MTSKAFFAALVSASLLAAPGCIGSAPLPTEPATPEARAELTAGSGRVAEQLLLVVHDLRVRPDQRADKQRIEDTLRGALATQRDAERSFYRALADATEQGSVDVPAVRERLAMMTAAADSAGPTIERVFDDLHRVLDAKQRREVADSVRARLALTQRRMDVENDDLFDDMATAADLATDRRDALHQKLDADPAIKEVRARREQARSHALAVVDAFVDDAFDAAKVRAGAGSRMVAENRGRRLVAILAAMLPTLDASARGRVASEVRQLGD